MTHHIQGNISDQGIVNPVDFVTLNESADFIMKEQFNNLYAVNIDQTNPATFKMKGIRNEINIDGYGAIDISGGIETRIEAGDIISIDLSLIYKKLGDYGDTITVSPVSNGESLCVWLAK